MFLSPAQRPSIEQFSEAVLAVSRAMEQKYVTEEEAELLLKHLVGVLLVNGLDSIIFGLMLPNRSERPREHWWHQHALIEWGQRRANYARTF